MIYCAGNLVLGKLRGYEDIIKLKEIYQTPHALLCAPPLLLPRKNVLLRGWYDSRMRYIFENSRDQDYLHDQEVAEILKAMEVLKQALAAQKRSHMKINIVE